MQADLCFDAATEGAMGGMLVCCPPVVATKRRAETPRRIPRPARYLLAFRAATAAVGGFPLLAVLVYVANEYPARVADGDMHPKMEELPSCTSVPC
jgi:hypothetical protein